MLVKLQKRTIDENDEVLYTDIPLYNTFTMDERLDEELDGGAAISYTKGAGGEEPLAEFTEMVVLLDDDDGSKRRIPFFGFDNIEMRNKAQAYYMHSFELVEPTRWLMGITCDGLAITQPIGDETKKTLYDTLARVLRCCNTQKKPASTTVAPMIFDIDEGIVPLLQAVISPEFKWQVQTLLFEILQDIGDVIDCIPRLTENTDGTFTLLTFDKVNDITAEYEL